MLTPLGPPVLINMNASAMLCFSSIGFFKMFIGLILNICSDGLLCLIECQRFY